MLDHGPTALINRPNTATLKGRRDRAILAVLLGCGLRREEVAKMRFEDIEQREGRWRIICGKQGRVRSVPMPNWAKDAIDEWAAAARLSEGRVFRGINRGGRLSGESLTPQGVRRCCEKYSSAGPPALRRTFAQLAHEGGVRLNQIQLSLGHASLATTARYLEARQAPEDAPGDSIELNLPAMAPPEEDYPRWMFHRSKAGVTVNSRREEAALGPEWSRAPWPAEP